MDFDRLTITVLALGDDAPGLTQQEDARQDTHMARLAGLHQARAPAGCWPAARPHLTALGLVHPFAGVEEARALKERDPAVRAGKYRIIALPWMVPAGAMTFSPTTFPRSTPEAAGI
jgi:hypothetical protein